MKYVNFLQIFPILYFYYTECALIVYHPGVFDEFAIWRHSGSVRPLEPTERMEKCELTINAKIYMLLSEDDESPPSLMLEDADHEMLDSMNVQKHRPANLSPSDLDYNDKIALTDTHGSIFRIQMFPCLLLDRVKYYLTCGFGRRQQYLFQGLPSIDLLHLIGSIEPTPMIDLDASKPKHTERLEEYFINVHDTHRSRNTEHRVGEARLTFTKSETNASTSSGHCFAPNIQQQFVLCVSVFDALNKSRIPPHKSVSRLNYMRINSNTDTPCQERGIAFRTISAKILSNVLPCAVNVGEWTEERAQFYLALDPNPEMSGVFVLEQDYETPETEKPNPNFLYVTAHISDLSALDDLD